MIISDANFYNSATQTAASLQKFLDAKGSACVANPDGTPCLRTFVMDTPAVADNRFCDALPATTRSTAAQIMSQVSSACGVNPEVLMVLIQKEQGLVTASGTTLTATRYAHATGAGCPDFAACDPSRETFFLQVYGAAQLFQKYRQFPASYNNQVGPATVRYNPEPSCGSASFTIKNQATAGLYNYTPYVPNAAALAAPNGPGDSCSSYGNLNFYRIMRSWFPASLTSSTASPVAPAAPSLVTPGLTGILAERDRVGGTATLGEETTETTCTSYTTGPCTKRFQYGTVSWSASTGGRTELGTGLAAQRLRWAGAGADEYATAGAVTASAFAESGVANVFVATGELFQDAMTGGAAAARVDGPLLLVNSRGIPASTAEQLTRLRPRRIYVLGGTLVVPDAVAQALAPYATEGVTRLAGANQYATANAISRHFWLAGSSSVLISRGDFFADALSAASLLPGHSGPVLLSTPQGLDQETLIEVSRLKPSRVLLVGGPAAVPTTVEQQLTQAGLSFTRLAGSDAYATSLAIGAAAYPSSATDAFLAIGTNFPDGLAVGPAAARRHGPVVLTNGKCLPAETARWLRSLDLKRLVLVGGTAVLPEALQQVPLC